ncbi:putative uncharacterized protein [Clostridium sp. CAG:230]|nr:putative uncharacterized protein [Clostridium sp. CAG:230]
MDMMYVEDCCEILDSMRVPIVASEREEGEYPYYGANGIQDYVADYIFDDELVLLAEDGGNFGSRERPIAYRVSGKCWVNNHAHVLKPKDELDVDYLCYSLMFYKVDGMVNGATRQKLTQAAMRKMQIPSRSMDEQKQIVDELNHIMKIKKQRQKELVLLDNLIKARFVEMFDSIKEEKLLGEISEFVTVGIANSATHAYAESGIPMLRNQNIRENYLDDSDLIYIKPEFAAKYESKELKENDIIVMRTGYPGVACLVPKKYEGCQTFTTLIVRLRSDNNPSYVCNYINSDFGKRFVDLEKVGVAQQNVGARSLAHMPIKIAPRELQDKFATFVKQIDKSKAAVQKALDETQMLFDSLMQEYFG